MSADVTLDKDSTAPTRSTTPRPAAWVDAGAAACRRAARRLSNWSETSTRYFRQRRAKDIGADITALARERPAQALAAAAILGMLVGGALHLFRRR